VGVADADVARLRRLPAGPAHRLPDEERDARLIGLDAGQLVAAAAVAHAVHVVRGRRLAGHQHAQEVGHWALSHSSNAGLQRTAGERSLRSMAIAASGSMPKCRTSTSPAMSAERLSPT